MGDIKKQHFLLALILSCSTTFTVHGEESATKELLSKDLLPKERLSPAVKSVIESAEGATGSDVTIKAFKPLKDDLPKAAKKKDEKSVENRLLKFLKTETGGSSGKGKAFGDLPISLPTVEQGSLVEHTSSRLKLDVPVATPEEFEATPKSPALRLENAETDLQSLSKTLNIDKNASVSTALKKIDVKSITKAVDASKIEKSVSDSVRGDVASKLAQKVDPITDRINKAISDGSKNPTAAIQEILNPDVPDAGLSNTSTPKVDLSKALDKSLGTAVDQPDTSVSKKVDTGIDKDAIEKQIAQSLDSLDTDKVNVDTPTIDTSDLTDGVAKDIAQDITPSVDQPDLSDVADGVDVDGLVDKDAIEQQTAVDVDDVGVDADDIKQQVDQAVDGVDADDIEKQIDQAVGLDDIGVDDVDVDDIEQQVEQYVDVDDIEQDVKQKVEESVDIDDIDQDLAQDINKQTSLAKETISADLTDAQQKILDGTNKAFDAIQAVVDQQKDDAYSDYLDKKSTYDNITVPDPEYKTVKYNCHRVWYTLGITTECDSKQVETDESIKNRTDAQTEKDVAEGEMDGAEDEYDKYVAASDDVENKRNDVTGAITDSFTGAQSTLDNSQFTVTVDTTDTSTDNSGDGMSRHDGSQDNDKNVLNIDGAVSETLFNPIDINAAIGNRTVATTSIGDINDLGKDQTINSVVEVVDVNADVNAAIGNDSTAEIRISNINGSVDGSIIHELSATGVVNASIGEKTDASLSLGNIDGDVGGNVTSDVNVAGAISASIGNESISRVKVGDNEGSVGNNLEKNIAGIGLVAASIGNRTTATVDIANIDPDASIGKSATFTAVQAGSAIAASIGNESVASIAMGNVYDDVSGKLNINVDTGPIISVSLGSNSESVIDIANVNEPVSGNVDIDAVMGDVTNFSLGYQAKAITDVATIDAPVFGNVDIDVVSGVIFTGAVGSGITAETIVGSVKERVHGNVSIDVTTGAISSFAIGIGVSADEITGKTAIGSVLQETYDNVNIDVTTGAVFTTGFGIELDLGALGTLKIIDQGCTNIGNVGRLDC